MTAYRCLVATPEGATNWRIVEAPRQDQAVAQILADGLTPLDVRSGAVGLVELLNRPVDIGGRPGISEQALLMRQLATLVGSGLPVDRSVDLLREQSPSRKQRELMRQVLTRVRAGDGLAAGFESTGVFPAYATGVVRSAEQTGRLAAALGSLAARMEAASATQRKLVTALAYPAAVLAATVIALVLVLTFVVPQFTPVFEGQEARLPALTRLVLATAALVDAYGWLLLILAVGSVVGLIAFVRSEAGYRMIEPAASRLPGSALRNQYLAAQFTGLLATLLENGVRVVPALALVRDATASRRWRRHIGQVEREVREGASLSAALAKDSIVPVTAIRLMEVGERTGKLGQSCARASEIMGSAASARIERIVALANPVAIVLLGGIVALMVAGVMLGIFALGDFAG